MICQYEGNIHKKGAIRVILKDVHTYVKKILEKLFQMANDRFLGLVEKCT